jgi:hypothetical protein
MFNKIELRFSKKSKTSKSIYYNVFVDDKFFEILRVSDHPNGNNYRYDFFSLHPKKVRIDTLIVWVTPKIKSLFIQRNVIPEFADKVRKKKPKGVPKMRNFNL